MNFPWELFFEAPYRKSDCAEATLRKGKCQLEAAGFSN